ncbi:MAG TPA: lytic transglycosylase domain-containing protein [Flavipsychrobacter sp.]
MGTTKQTLAYVAFGMTLSVAAVAGFAFRESDKNEGTVEVKENSKLQYKWYQVDMPKAMSFAGERVPLERWDVRERLDRELNINYYMHGSTLYVLKLTTRYFPMIEEILKENGVPDDFKYLCVAESSLQPSATSAVGAASFWQFMKDTGPQYGLEIRDEVDERYHARKATQAACTYLKAAYAKFGTWTAAAASYNCGMGGYNSHSTFQGFSNYYDIALPEETNRYVFRILALKHLLSNPAFYGYILEGEEKYRPIKTRTVTVTSTISDLAAFAKENGSTYKMLKLQNPWLRARTLTVKPGKSYEIEFPLDKQ